jgi:hypothetical protein
MTEKKKLYQEVGETRNFSPQKPTVVSQLTYPLENILNAMGVPKLPKGTHYDPPLAVPFSDLISHFKGTQRAA